MKSFGKVAHPIRCGALLVAGLLVGAVTYPAAAGQSADKQSSGLDQLVGSWQLKTEVSVGDGTTMQGAGRLDVHPILDGRGIRLHERQNPLVEGRPEYTEVTILFLGRDGTSLQGSSINSLGNRKQLDGEFSGNAATMEQTGQMFGGRPGRNRVIWSDISVEGFSLRLDRYDESTSSWHEGIYTFVATRAE